MKGIVKEAMGYHMVEGKKIVVKHGMDWFDF